MRICTGCGHVLSDKEDFCSICGSDLILDTSGDQDGEVRGTLSALSSMLEDAGLPDVPDLDDDIPAIGSSSSSVSSEEESHPSSSVDAHHEDDNNDTPSDTAPADISASEHDEDPGAVLPWAETSDEEPVSGENNDSVSDDSPDTNAEKKNFRIVSVSVKNNEGIAHVNRGRIIAVVVTLLFLISVILSVFMIVVPLVQARQQDEAAKETAYMDFLRGRWLSDTFIYSGKEYPSCEILTVGKDGTFTSEIWTSPNDRETYDPQTWTLTASQTGDLHLELETSSLRVSYTDSDGNTMVYRRYILGLDFSSLILREYYNETMTDYYDVVFSRQEGMN